MGIPGDRMEMPCPACGHSNEDHRRESWFDEEGVEGMTCDVCEDEDRRCQWWTWDWNEVIDRTAPHEGSDELTD